MSETVLPDIGDPKTAVSVSPAGSSVLGSVALVLNSSLDLAEVLRRLAAITLRETGAQRCSILLLEEGRLVPRAAIGEVPDEDLWAAFRSMGEIRLSDIDGGKAVLRNGRAVGIYEAAASELIPQAWVDRFQLRSLIVVPLLAEGDPCGVMVVDYGDYRLLPSELLMLVEAIGSCAAIAVRNARRYEAARRRSRLQSALADAAKQLMTSSEQESLAARLVEACMRIVPATSCAIGLLNDSGTEIEAIATKGRLPKAVSLAEVPPEIIRDLGRRWSLDELVDLGDREELEAILGGGGDIRYHLLPLKAGDRLQGGILIGSRADVSFRRDEKEALVALAAIASASLERGLLLDALGRQVDEMRMLHALGDVLAGRMDAETLVARLDRLLRRRGYRVAGLSFKSGNLQRRLRGAAPDEWDRAAWSRRRLVEAGDGTLRVPVVVGRRAIGSMKLRTKRHRADRPFLQALAGGVGEIALRAALRSELEESEREVALTTERGRIAAELSDTIGQTFMGLALGIDRATRGLDEGSPVRATLQELVGEASRGAVEVQRVSRSMATFPEARLGIVPALVALAESFEDDGGPVLLVDARGPARLLPPMVERILYRAAHEILSLATRHSRCSVLRLEIVFEPDGVSMIVDDDGTGASSRGHELPYRTGLLAARRSLQEAGGALRLTSRRPHGSRIVVSIPAAQ